MGRKHCGKRRKCWLPAFSPFLTMFSKGFFCKVVKSQDYVVDRRGGLWLERPPSEWEVMGSFPGCDRPKSLKLAVVAFSLRLWE